jgi:hypothetical protein
MLDLAETLSQRARNMERRAFVVEHNLIDYPYTGTVTIVKDTDGTSSIIA